VYRRARLPLSLVWLVTVLGTWTLTTAVLALLIGPPSNQSVGGLVAQSTASALLACGVVGGPATAAALRVWRTRGCGPAALAGTAVAALILVFIWSFMTASGAALAGAWSAVTPAVIVSLVQLAAALALCGRGTLVTPTAAEPESPSPE
jgi:hypothetical protein